MGSLHKLTKTVIREKSMELSGFLPYGLWAHKTDLSLLNSSNSNWETEGLRVRDKSICQADLVQVDFHMSKGLVKRKEETGKCLCYR